MRGDQFLEIARECFEGSGAIGVGANLENGFAFEFENAGDVLEKGDGFVAVFEEGGHGMRGANGIGFEEAWGLAWRHVSTFDGEFEYGVADGNTDRGGLRYWFVDCREVAAADAEDDGDDVADDWGVTGCSGGGWGGDEGVARAGVREWGASSVGFDSDRSWFGGGCGDFLIWFWLLARGCRLAPLFFDDA